MADKKTLTLEPKDGGAAYPTARVSLNGHEALDGVEFYGPGMSLRDHFASHALSGLLASPEPRGEAVSQYPELCDVIAEAAYGYADAMLKARKGGL